jgi:hypothetical protein
MKVYIHQLYDPMRNVPKTTFKQSLLEDEAVDSIIVKQTLGRKSECVKQP